MIVERQSPISGVDRHKDARPAAPVRVRGWHAALRHGTAEAHAALERLPVFAALDADRPALDAWQAALTGWRHWFAATEAAAIAVDPDFAAGRAKLPLLGGGDADPDPGGTPMHPDAAAGYWYVHEGMLLGHAVLWRRWTAAGVCPPAFWQPPPNLGHRWQTALAWCADRVPDETRAVDAANAWFARLADHFAAPTAGPGARP